VPLLRELLAALEDGRVEAAIRAGDQRAWPVFDEGEYETEVSW